MPAERVWWASALQWAIWGIVMSLMMAWLARSRARRPAAARPGELRLPVSMLVVGILGTVMFPAGAFGIFLLDEPIPAWVYLILLALTAPGLYVVIEYFTVRIDVDDHGIRWSTPLRGSGRAAWSDVRRVTYSRYMKWFRIETSTDQVVRVSAMLSGLPEFARLVLTRTPAGVIESRTDAILKNASIGNLPPVWG